MISDFRLRKFLLSAAYDLDTQYIVLCPDIKLAKEAIKDVLEDFKNLNLSGIIIDNEVMINTGSKVLINSRTSNKPTYIFYDESIGQP